ncbi:MAG: ABC transporter permease [Patescibacteria group bacterium]
MWRKKFRSFLTIFGIAIGIFAFTVMGSMALRFNKMIQGGKRFITGQITLMPKGSTGYTGGAATLPLNTLNEIAKVDGVEAVSGIVELSLEEPDPDNPIGSGVSFGVPPTIEGTDFNTKYRNRNWEELAMKEGRMVGPGDADTNVTIGYTIALDKKLHAGDTMKIRGRDFTVVGVLDKTMTGPDTYVFMSINIARQMLIESVPFLKSLQEQATEAAKISDQALAKLPEETRKQLQQAKLFNPEDINSMAGISWKDGVDPDALSNTIKEKFKNEVMVLSPKMMGDTIDKASAIFNAVILGSALLALIVGGFSIVNTMLMSISERTKEIGVRKALGASPSSIARDFTVEAGVIGLIGGIIGIGFGLLMIVLLNRALAGKGAEIFIIDTTFLLSVIGFSFVLGVIAGVLPAWRAARLQVVQALREL